MRTLLLNVHSGGDSAETDRLTRQLRAELLALDLERIDITADGDIPPNAKSADPATVSTIIVAVAGSPVLIQLARVLQSVVTRGKNRTITVYDGNRSLKITGANAEDNRRVIEEFFREEED